MIINRTQLNAVIGFPLEHSRSPSLHNAIYKKLGLNAVLFAMPHKDIKKLARFIKTAHLGMVIVTMPHKQSIIPYLDSLSAEAKAIKAVNTVINKNGKLKGFNTDIDGIARAFKGIKLAGKNVLLLGAGGAARAAAYFLFKQKANIYYLNRTRQKAVKLKKDFGGKVVKLEEVDPEKINVIINATPIGMPPKNKEMPVPKSFLRKGQIVFDVVYNQGSTELLKQARKKGAAVISGMEMFVGQALRQIELYTGKKLQNGSIAEWAFKAKFENFETVG